MDDPRSILGLAPHADARAARAAFRAIAKTCHPDRDRDPAARARFEAAREACRAIMEAERLRDRGGGRRPEIDLAVSVRTAARGGVVRGSCPLGRASVRVPAGARDGDRVAARFGKTEAVGIIRIVAADGFEAEGGDVRATLSLSRGQARLGGPIEIEAPAGRIVLMTPQNMDEGDRLLVAGRGLPARNGRPAGDLMLEIAIEDSLADRAAAAIDQMLAKAGLPRKARPSDTGRRRSAA